MDGEWAKRQLFRAALVVSVLYVVWPVMIMVLEGFSIDLSPLFSGKGVRFVGGVPYYSGGIYPTLVHYTDAIFIAQLPRFMANSVVISLANVAIALLVSIPAAYLLARIDFKGRNGISFALLALRTVSPIAIVIPLYLLFNQTGLWDTYWGMSLAYLSLDIPVIVWLMKGFFADVPSHVYEAAEISGAAERTVFFRVGLPMIWQGIVAAAVFSFLIIWNEFIFASLLTGPVTTTAAVGIWAGGGEPGAGALKPIDLGELNASASLALIPALALVIAIRRYLAKAFTLGIAR